MASDKEKGDAVQEESLDVKGRYARAKALVAAGSLGEAATEFVWLWQNIFERQPSMSGVRVSFMATEMRALARLHSGARECFLALRDELVPLVDSGAATSMQLGDWVVLCDVVDENARVTEWFDRMGPNALPAHLQFIALRLTRLLKANGRWVDIGRLYVDPLRELRDRARLLTDAPALAAKRPEAAAQIRSSMEQHVVGEAGTLYAALRAAGRDADALTVLEEARRLMPGAPLETAIAEALKAAGIEAATDPHGSNLE